MPCDICQKKTDEIRDILRPYSLNLVEPVEGVRILARMLQLANGRVEKLELRIKLHELREAADDRQGSLF